MIRLCVFLHLGTKHVKPGTKQEQSGTNWDQPGTIQGQLEIKQEQGHNWTK